MEPFPKPPTRQESRLVPSFSFALPDFWSEVDDERLLFEATQKDERMLGNFRMFPENGLPLKSGRRGMIFDIAGEQGPHQGRAVGILVGDGHDWRNSPNEDGVEAGRIHSACRYSLYGESTSHLISELTERVGQPVNKETVAAWLSGLSTEAYHWRGKNRMQSSESSVVDERAMSAYKIARVVEVIHDYAFVDAEPSPDCDCREQGRIALAATIEDGGWFMENCDQEGRGHGLAVKAAIYELQRKGLNTALACLALGIPWDVRDYSHNARTLRQWSDNPTIKRNFMKVRLRSNNPRKAEELRKEGIIVEEVDHMVGVTMQNLDYLLTKASQGYRLGADELHSLVELADDSLAN
jgi:GTP cyclohydrolase II